MDNYCYFFAKDQTEGSISQTNILGNKGAYLAEMCKLSIAVPPGFTISTEICNYFYQNQYKLPENFDQYLEKYITKLETYTGSKFGDNINPLLLSVRSGSSISMPGMMDTILNLGLNDQTVEALAQQSDNEIFAYDCYRRFIQMLGNVVYNIMSSDFEEIFSFHQGTLSNKDSYKKLIQDYKELIFNRTGQQFPHDCLQQLKLAIIAVIKSWNNERARVYRKINNIDNNIGTAVNIQTMVFGNYGLDSATGVCFSRDPVTGEKYLYGEYLLNAQGEDIVAGSHTPQQITEQSAFSTKEQYTSLEYLMPDIFQELKAVSSRLENYFKDMQDIEFTIQQGKLWILQTRSGKRTIQASCKIAVDLVNEEIITIEQALELVEAQKIDHLLHPQIDPTAEYNILAKALPASSGASYGEITLNADEAVIKSNNGINVILVRDETSAEDIMGMHSANGILTARGGMTSHAAVIARSMGKSCVCGCKSLMIDQQNNSININGQVLKAGEIITIDGSTGNIIKGKVSTITPELTKEIHQLINWAKARNKVKIKANAETIEDIKNSLDFGANSIGLCRTEHMFFAQDRINLIRKLILDKDDQVLEKIKNKQLDDFMEIYNIMLDRPVAIRLLDPPLHEFMPKDKIQLKNIAKELAIEEGFLRHKINEISEQNPMLGHRGCRLAISHPEIYLMQVEAIILAALEVMKQQNINIVPEIMIPFVMDDKELAFLINKIKTHIDFIKGEQIINYKIGAMIEVPRAALLADRIAPLVDFISFGTNDLTQMTMGLSRDDSVKFWHHYQQHQLFDYDPFVTLDLKAVGELIKIAVDKALKTNDKIDFCICGEQGAELNTIKFALANKINYISCSPYKILTAIINSGKI